MDQWMLQFLQRYMKPVTDKTTSLSHLPGGVRSPDMPGESGHVVQKTSEVEQFHTGLNITRSVSKVLGSPRFFTGNFESESADLAQC